MLNKLVSRLSFCNSGDTSAHFSSLGTSADSRERFTMFMTTGARVTAWSVTTNVDMRFRPDDLGVDLLLRRSTSLVDTGTKPFKG